jgi:hypothetical protein
MFAPAPIPASPNFKNEIGGGEKLIYISLVMMKSGFISNFSYFGR